MGKPGLPPLLDQLLQQVKGKRARIVVDHIRRHGAITTRELKEQYGYDHPPRAIKDVTDQGVPIERRTVVDASGRRIAEYRFGDPTLVRAGRVGGRRAFSKAFKQQLSDEGGERCGLCHAPFPGRALQIDHRVPYEVTGNPPTAPLNTSEFMLLCGSCNRAKSWSCEQCDNWRQRKDPATCRTCYWAHPACYEHVGMVQLRRLDLTWTAAEVPDFEALRAEAANSGTALPLYVKALLRSQISRQGPGGVV